MTGRKFRTSAVDAGKQLGDWLVARAGAGAVGAVARGSVFVDGRRVTDPALVLGAGQRIELRTAAPDTPGEREVFRDADVLVMDKPSGLPTQAPRAGGDSLEARVRRPHPAARVLHRIDRDASGLVLFSLSAGRRAELQRALAEHAIVREYLAVVSGVPDKAAFSLSTPIGRDPADHRRSLASTAAPNARPAVSHVRVERRAGPLTLLHVRLETGRTHQIRAHLAGAGLPIAGDPLYAPPEVRALAPRLALHAVRLTWPGGVAESPLPADLAAILP